MGSKGVCGIKLGQQSGTCRIERWIGFGGFWRVGVGRKRNEW